MKINYIGIVANFEKEKINYVINQITKLVKENNLNVAILKDTVNSKTSGMTEIDTKGLLDFSDLIFSLGGDGTLISTSRLIGNKQIPIIGVNIGGLGFLTSANSEDLEDVFSKLLNEKFSFQNRMMHHVSVLRTDECIKKFTTLNELVIARSEISRIMRFSISANNSPITSFFADGLIVATPTGSTAYSLSAGGPVINPTMEAFVLTPICPQALSVRPMVLSHNETLTIKIDEQPGKFVLTLDGQVMFPLETNDIIEVKKESFVTKLLVFNDYSFYSILQNKLNWGSNTFVDKKFQKFQ